MDDLGLDVAGAASWFLNESNESFELVRVPDHVAASFAQMLAVPVRRCYVSDAALEARAIKHGLSKDEIVRAVLPDPGPVMAGDFGEILVYLFHAARHAPQMVKGPKKWRLKHDRRKPCPHSDVVQFIVPGWPVATEQDQLICAEVKCKSTASTFRPISRAIEGCAADRTSRLSRTLVWLRERALITDDADTEVALLDRFIKADAYPPTTKQFAAVAVVCESLLAETRTEIPSNSDSAYSVIILTIPELHAVYNAVFAAAADGADAHGIASEE